MNPADFLKLIGAPWSAYHDHSDPTTAASLAEIRPTGMPKLMAEEVCSVTLCNYDADGTGRRQRARRDLIVQAPRMYLYIVGMAASGDTEARMLLQQIHGETK